MTDKPDFITSIKDFKIGNVFPLFRYKNTYMCYICSCCKLLIDVDIQENKLAKYNFNIIRIRTHEYKICSTCVNNHFNIDCYSNYGDLIATLINNPSNNTLTKAAIYYPT